MGDTKESVSRAIKITRIITATMVGLSLVIALAQVIFFHNIIISFESGIDAQHITPMEIKKGSTVTFPTPLKPGAYFLGWSLDPNSGECLADSNILTSDTTLYAVWDGSEKYAVLKVNDLPFKEVNIFDTSVEGITATELNANWRVLDDVAADNPNLINIFGVMADPNNNFKRFLGWQYLNANGTYNDLAYADGVWTWVRRDSFNAIIDEIIITDETKFYPPNYRTTFTALLEYRPIYIEMYETDGITRYDEVVTTLGASNVKLPVYHATDAEKENAAENFSYWKIDVGYHLDLYAKSNPLLYQRVNEIGLHYVTGEVVDTLDPLWYYLGNNLYPGTNDDDGHDLVVQLALRATNWQDATEDQFTYQKYTDQDSGTVTASFANIGIDDLSYETPIGYDYFDQNLLLYYDRNIASYNFYDHKGNYHEISYVDLKNGLVGVPIRNGGASIKIGEIVATGNEDETIYFYPGWGINVKVIYQTAAQPIKVIFNYGSDLYRLKDYEYLPDGDSHEFPIQIGKKLILESGESFLRRDYLFYGWRLRDENYDENDFDNVYCAGDTFVIPNMDTTQNNTIEFVAVWRIQRLLFNFNFNGGTWSQEPDFTYMKGAYGTRVQIVNDIPVKFGYTFLGWTLNDNQIDDDTVLYQPGEWIMTATNIQTLYAQWVERDLRVLFLMHTDASDEWNRVDPIYYVQAGDTIELPVYSLNMTPYYNFYGWQLGSVGIPVVLTTDILSQLEYVEDGALLEVHIYAVQERRTTNITYDLTDFGNLVLETSDWNTVLRQDSLFCDYKPFNIAPENLDSKGRRFLNWVYIINGRSIPIYADTRVPIGYDDLLIGPSWSSPKSFTVQYHTFDGSYYQTDPQVYHFNGGVINLLDTDQLDLFLAEGQEVIPTSVYEWGTFIGWATSQDYIESNPELVFNVFYADHPVLKLDNIDNTLLDPVNNTYQINIDKHSQKIDDKNYVLHLYAVYARDFVRITYEGYDGDIIENDYPVYSHGIYTQTVLGGKTVGNDSPDFGAYGLAVRDEADSKIPNSYNFIGWQATIGDGVEDGVAQEIKDYFEHKLWFPGEYLPAIDFNIKFTAICLPRRNEIITLYYDAEFHDWDEYKGEEPLSAEVPSYQVYSLRDATISRPIIGKIDIVALPRGNYTIATKGLVINSTSEVVRIVVPAKADEENVITLEPMSIQCDQVVEFYISDSLQLTASPVVGKNFQAYRVRKGYILRDDLQKQIGASEKYDFSSSLQGLLVRREPVPESDDQLTLLGVPNHTPLSTAQFRTALSGISKIVGYALADLNSLATISLTNNALQIDANAIFGGNVQQIILPLNSNKVSAACLAGSLNKLVQVAFSDGYHTDVKSNYAFVADGFVYFIDSGNDPTEKTHVMYVLPDAELTSLDYTTRNLRFADSVEAVEQYALAGRDWSQIYSVMAMHPRVDLLHLQGVDKSKPFFVAQNNPNQSGKVQSYIKILEFVDDKNNGITRYAVEYKYGQSFTPFDAKNNPYDFSFSRTYARFIGWKLNRTMLYLEDNNTYQIGAGIFANGNKFTLDASGNDSWQYYPVWFHLYDGTSEVPLFDVTMYDNYDEPNAYRLNDLFSVANDLNIIYLPGLNQSFTASDGSVYQFIGWSKKKPNSNNLTDWLWNNVSFDCRILPNHTPESKLDSAGTYVTEGRSRIYNYYALYEKVSQNLDFGNPINDDTAFAVKLSSNTNDEKMINIPYAHYYQPEGMLGGFMLPVTTITNNAFSSGYGQNLNEIVIGGAVDNIGNNAFYNVQAKKITFAHRGASIYYNNGLPTEKSTYLTIGNNAFAKNNLITNLVLPAALLHLGDGAFASCINLQDVVFDHTDETPILSSLGNFVFRDDSNMINNEIVIYLVQDGKEGNRFKSVGMGIFRNTKVLSATNMDRIVWRGTLLYAYYVAGGSLTYNEERIAGYAFTDLRSLNSNQLSIYFKSSNTRIDDSAFSNLNTTIGAIDLRGVDINKVSTKAFDITVQHRVDVHVGQLSTWGKAGFKNIGGFVFV